MPLIFRKGHSVCLGVPEVPGSPVSWLLKFLFCCGGSVVGCGLNCFWHCSNPPSSPSSLYFCCLGWAASISPASESAAHLSEAAVAAAPRPDRLQHGTGTDRYSSGASGVGGSQQGPTWAVVAAEPSPRPSLRRGTSCSRLLITCRQGDRAESRISPRCCCCQGKPTAICI